MIRNASAVDRSTTLRMFVIYENPLDYPDHFVVREWSVIGEQSFPHVPCAIVKTRAEAQAAIPPGFCNIGRHEQDDPAIREVWI